MEKGRYKAVIFDLDGTLVDSLGDIAASVNSVLTDMNLPTHESEFYRDKVGWGLKQTMALTVPGLDSDDLDKAAASIVDYYRKEPGVHARIYDGILPALNRLREMGLSLYVYTNKDQVTAERIVEKKFGRAFFTALFGAAGGSPLKPDTAGIRTVIERTGFRPEEILYVGDSEVDMETAVNGKLDSLAVLWGYRSRKELDGYPKLAFIERPDEITGWI